MRRSVVAAVPLAIAALAAATVPLMRDGSRAVVARSATADPVVAVFDAEAEVERVRAHLVRVEDELRAADVTHLTASQREARSRHLAVLREYHERGLFPHNHTVPDRRVPVFVDEHGTHCAVGYLLARDGRHDIVERIASERNLATVPELADDAELAAWLDGAGLSVEEAARIQPAYGGPPSVVPDESGSSAYVTASMIGTGLGGGMIAWNLIGGSDASRGRRGALGLGVGLAEVALGGIGLALDREADRKIDATHIALNFGVGFLASALGLNTLLSGGGAAAAPAIGGEAGDAGDATSRELLWSVSPWTPGTRGGGGVRVNLRF